MNEKTEESKIDMKIQEELNRRNERIALGIPVKESESKTYCYFCLDPIIENTSTESVILISIEKYKRGLINQSESLNMLFIHEDCFASNLQGNVDIYYAFIIQTNLLKFDPEQQKWYKQKVKQN